MCHSLKPIAFDDIKAEINPMLEEIERQ